MTFHVPESARIRSGLLASDKSYGNNGAFLVTSRRKQTLLVIASDQLGWEHVSVSLPNRTPYWDEMCLIKDLFLGAEDCVVQYHPPRSEYVNFHPHCLHLWRQVGGQPIPMPPGYLVGPIIEGGLCI